MTILRNTFDGGTNGTSMTTANAGGASGDTFAGVEASVVFSNEQAHTGTLSMKPPSTTSTGLARWAASGDRTLAFRGYVYFTAAHTGDYNFAQLLVINTSTIALTVQVQGTNQLRLRNNTTSINPWTATSSLPLNQWVRVEMLVQQGTTTTDGQVRVAYYLADSPTAVEDSGWLTGQNIRGDGGTINGVRFGKLSGTAYSGSAYFDTVGVNTGANYAGFIGPAIVPNPPTTFRWNGSTYVGLDGYRWNGSTYVPVTTA